MSAGEQVLLIVSPISFLSFLLALAGLALLQSANVGQPPSPRFQVIAHRGAHPFYYGEDTINRRTGCSATLLHEAEPAFIENTLASMDAAFRAGATMIELDVHHTSDDQLVVFHDAGLECRTNGHGAPEQHTLADLRTLDAGYGYSADGRTFPFRGRGIGLIPSLREVLDAFPDRGFVIDDKAERGSTPRLLGELLASYPPQRQRTLIYWGSASAYSRVHALARHLGRRLLNQPEMLACRDALARRLGLGALPAACRDGTLIIPAWQLTPWYVRTTLGWPDRFIAKVHTAGSGLIVFTDSAEEAVTLRMLPIDGIMTDRITVVGPSLR